MDLKNEMHCELAKANTMDHAGVYLFVLTNMRFHIEMCGGVFD